MCPIGNFPIFAPVNPRENGLMKKAHFSLYSIIVKLGHFCCKGWNKGEDECFYSVCNRNHFTIQPCGAVI